MQSSEIVEPSHVYSINWGNCKYLSEMLQCFSHVQYGARTIFTFRKITGRANENTDRSIKILAISIFLLIKCVWEWNRIWCFFCYYPFMSYFLLQIIHMMMKQQRKRNTIGEVNIRYEWFVYQLFKEKCANEVLLVIYIRKFEKYIMNDELALLIMFIFPFRPS